MKKVDQVIQCVGTIYKWLENELNALSQSCRACGDCCDFDAFGHRLYVTTPELVYFQHFVGPDIRPMATGICPYRIDGKCTVYSYRFAACRIFTCKGDAEKENAVCEQTLRKFKELCKAHEIPYHYVHLQAGLEMIQEDQFKIQN